DYYCQSYDVRLTAYIF
nr:immunoglobulin light chain junction region [Macaca mulatta]MOX82748.1 immunoglobulin light chain junction region [Macaca mulatta]